MNMHGIIIFTLLAALLTAGCGRKTAGTITIAGSSTIEPIIQLMAREYKEKKNVDISLSIDGSKTGIGSLINGDCLIAASSVEMTAEEKKAAENHGEVIKEFTIGYDIIVPIVHPSNPLENLSVTDIRGIYSGRIKNWKEIGGQDEPIAVVSRDRFSGTGAVWNREILHSSAVKKDAVMSHTSSEVLGHVAKHGNAIGYVSYHVVNSEVKKVGINGVMAKPSEGINKNYPAYRKMYLYVNEKAFPPEVKSFIVFFLSNEGQRTIKNAGYIPVSKSME